MTAEAPLRVRFTLPEKFIGQMKKGQPVAADHARMSPKKNISLRVIEISPVVDPASGTIESARRNWLAAGATSPRHDRQRATCQIRNEHHPGPERRPTRDPGDARWVKRYPRVHPGVSEGTCGEGERVVRAFVPSADAMYKFPASQLD